MMLKKVLATIAAVAMFLPSNASDPDSVYLFAYASAKNGGRNGLHFAWSSNGNEWTSIGNEFGFVHSDYGRWGSQKRMISPVLFQSADGWWHCIWALNEEVNQFAHAASPDLLNWGRQSYPYLQPTTKFVDPVVGFDGQAKAYLISFGGTDQKRYLISTKDFKTYSPIRAGGSSVPLPGKKEVLIGKVKQSGTMHRVSWKLIEQLVNAYQSKQFRNTIEAEDARKDSLRFAGMKPVDLTLTLQPANAKAISTMLTGVFFEDINYAADGGLYAELIQNRDFEYNLSDKEGNDKTWTSTHSWSAKGEGVRLTIDSSSPIHPNNPHYAVIRSATANSAISNAGFDGIPVKAGESYRFSIFLKKLDQQSKSLLVKLVTKDGEVIAQTLIRNISASWKKYPATLIAAKTVADLHLELQLQETGDLAVDMVSLFPAKTFKQRNNGLRPDLARAIADIHPKFVRFPGGCVAHGDGLANIYRWKNTIGPLEARVPQRNLWGYHQTAGLGYFEYFQFCEDIGAAPLPVVAAGVPCQNSGTGGGGQQGGIPMEEMNAYVQDVLDLIEYANGDIKTTWGKKRAESGHPAPFNLKYIGVGNEDLITDVFEERYLMICRAVKAKYPDITVIGTVGPFFEGTDYREGWAIANREKIEMVDEHYYQTPGWFINNQDFYDSYDRTKSKVYLGEYASWGSSLYNALAEAIYLTSLERNGDVVSMASYAPLLAKEGHTQWNPDLIYFNNTEIKPTIGYEVQKLYGNHAGDSYIPVIAMSSSEDRAVAKRIASSVVRDSRTGDIIVKLVNLLPAATTVKIELNGLNIPSQEAVKIELYGKPGDRTAAVINSTLKVESDLLQTLQPYSFTVLRMKTVK